MNQAIALSPSLETTATLAERILDTFPSGAYAMSALLRLLDIVETTAVPTAAVECRIQPRLLVNPEFAARHAGTDEKLLMLVMHELHHVLLGHTTLFPRITPVQNFVFDAVINGIVCRMFSTPEHVTFFTDFYSADSFPECLLRPPPGWPVSNASAPGLAVLPEPQRSRATELHAALYSAAGASYDEIYAVLGELVKDGAVADISLLGGHDAPGDEVLTGQSPLLFDIAREIVEQWPQPPDPICGRSLADVLQETIAPRRPPSNRAVLRGLIRKVAGAVGQGGARQIREESMEALTPIPSLARRSLVQRALGYEPLLQSSPVPWRRQVKVGERVHIYVDVSGSMDAVKGALYGAVLDCAALVHPTVHLFSTRIADISLAELRRGVCKSTGGTHIGCVAEHMAAGGIRRAVLVTDGWVGTPKGAHRNTLAKAKLAVAFLGRNVNPADLNTLANHTATLLIGAKS